MTDFFGVMIAGILVVILACILGSLMGAFAGMIVSLFFGNAIQSVFMAMGMAPVALWKVGATLGFVGGFFRNTAVGKG